MFFAYAFLIQGDCWSGAELCLRINGWFGRIVSEEQNPTEILFWCQHCTPPPTSLTSWSHDSLPLLTSYLYYCFSSVSLYLLLLRLHYVVVTKISVASQCKHLFLVLATYSTLSGRLCSVSRRLCSWGPWAKWCLLTTWGNTIRDVAFQLPQQEVEPGELCGLFSQTGNDTQIPHGSLLQRISVWVTELKKEVEQNRWVTTATEDPRKIKRQDHLRK